MACRPAAAASCPLAMPRVQPHEPEASESQARMGMPRRTSPAGTIQSCSCAGWNASAHHISSAAPPSPTVMRPTATAYSHDPGELP